MSKKGKIDKGNPFLHIAKPLIDKYGFKVHHVSDDGGSSIYLFRDGYGTLRISDHEVMAKDPMKGTASKADVEIIMEWTMEKDPATKTYSARVFRYLMNGEPKATQIDEWADADIEWIADEMGYDHEDLELSELMDILDETIKRADLSYEQTK